MCHDKIEPAISLWITLLLLLKVVVLCPYPCPVLSCLAGLQVNHKPKIKCFQWSASPPVKRSWHSGRSARSLVPTLSKLWLMSKGGTRKKKEKKRTKRPCNQIWHDKGDDTPLPLTTASLRVDLLIYHAHRISSTELVLLYFRFKL